MVAIEYQYLRSLLSDYVNLRSMSISKVLSPLLKSADLKRQKLLLEVTDEKGRTTLHWAVKRGQKGMVKCIMNDSVIGTDLLTVRDYIGRTAIHQAADVGCWESIELMLNVVMSFYQQKAIVEMQDAYGWTAIDLARRKNYVKACVSLDKYSSTKEAVKFETHDQSRFVSFWNILRKGLGAQPVGVIGEDSEEEDPEGVMEEDSGGNMEEDPGGEANEGPGVDANDDPRGDANEDPGGDANDDPGRDVEEDSAETDEPEDGPVIEKSNRDVIARGPQESFSSDSIRHSFVCDTDEKESAVVITLTEPANGMLRSVHLDFIGRKQTDDEREDNSHLMEGSTSEPEQNYVSADSEIGMAAVANVAGAGIKRLPEQNSYSQSANVTAETAIPVNEKCSTKDKLGAMINADIPEHFDSKYILNVPKWLQNRREL
ncbi:uncharacterized protein [Watersipora subatra]|uniref:uncharacterized protein n=1 Tax=Watersipora subatra TaxID=2589382 RepID=UPI00355ADEF3